MRLKVKKKLGCWIVVGLPGGRRCGPYKTRAEAVTDRRGMERFYQTCGKEVRDGAKVL